LMPGLGEEVVEDLLGGSTALPLSAVRFGVVRVRCMASSYCDTRHSTPLCG